MMTHEILVDGQHAATVSVRDPVELLSHVAMIRRVWDAPVIEVVDGERFEWFRDPDEGGVVITSRIIRMR